MKENSIIINQALEALKASLPVDDVVTLTSAGKRVRDASIYASKKYRSSFYS